MFAQRLRFNHLRGLSFLPRSLNCIKTTRCTSTALATMDMKQAITNQTDFGLRMAHQLFLTKGKEKNMVYSPLSVHVVLSLIAARDASTRDKMLSFLKAQSTDELNSLAARIVPLVFADGIPGGPCLNFANGLWVDKSDPPLDPCFKQVVDTFYKAALEHVDFINQPEQVRIEVNSWAAKETKGLVKEILSQGSVTSLTRQIFANALYFKGLWAERFIASRTREYKFHLLNGESVNAPFMTSREDQIVKAFDGFKVLKLEYEKGNDEKRQFSMCLFLPDAQRGLHDLLQRVCSEPSFLDRHLPRWKDSVRNFRIPKFKMTSAFEASDILKDLGLVLDSRILHKSVIEVNEEGTEAAAVTVGGLQMCAKPPVDFVADHPFLYLIREETTGAVFFMGQVLNPLQD